MSEFVWELPAVRPTPTPSVESTDGTIDHAQAAVDRLVTRFRKPKMIQLVRSLCKPMATLEQAWVDLLTMRSLDTAVGAQLNLLAKLVGQPIVDVTDTTFRSIIRARVAANKASGMGDEVLKVSRLVLSDYAALPDVVDAGAMALLLQNQGRAAFVLRVDNIDLPWDLAYLLAEKFLQVIAGTGIRAILEFTVQLDPLVFDDHTRMFSFDDHENATATFLGQFVVGQKEGAPGNGGAAGNGRTIQLISSVGNFSPFIDESTPTAILVYFFPAAFVSHTWADLFAAIGTSGYIEVLSSTASGDMVSGNAGIRTFSGGADATGLGYADQVGYPQRNIGANSVLGYGDWTHIHLCDDVDTQDSAADGGLDLTENGTPLYQQDGVVNDDDKAFAVGDGNGFITASTDLMPGALDDVLLAATIVEHGSGGTAAQILAATDFATYAFGLSLYNELVSATFQDATHSVTTASIAAPVGPFVAMLAFERATGKCRVGVCAKGGTPVVSAESAIPVGLGAMTGGNFYVGLGDLAVPMTVSHWMGGKGVAACGGLSANMADALAAYAATLDATGGPMASAIG